jgi:WD40 repeat protein
MQTPAPDIQQAHVAAQWAYDSPLVTCRFDPRGRFVFSSAEDNKIQRWDLATGNKVVLAAHDSWVFSLAALADGETLLSGGGDGKLIWWPAAAEAPTPTRIVDAHQGWVRAMAVSPSGQQLATGGNDRVVRIWNLADGAKTQELPGHEVPVYSLLWHPSGQSLVSGDLRGNVKQWDLATNSLARSFDAKPLHSYNGGQQVDFGGVRSLALSPDGKHLACAGLHKAENPLGAVLEPLVLVFEWESQKLVRQQIAEGLKGPLWRVQYLSDGTLVGVLGGSSGGFLIFWKADQDKDIHRFQLPNLARDMDLHADGLQIATTHADRHLRISKLAMKAG